MFSSIQSQGAAKPADSNSPQGMQQMFLQLLVAQLKNQDPTTPSDPTQFVGQLAQFSELEQVVGIHQDLDSMKTAGAAAPVTNTQGN
jgi:flagellar basal-body rod modification protein FlgD